ncbi:glycosyltransferase [Liquorilactobacillus ghanensis DSM 18630]|uniref:Glycosyltransferase n=1 Tax=Liquorilactobacillus ghanensis DSM 18630 TaxID=1423750 RepID=A0A0R1VUQ5_9LACO|nr:glycosyltransferase [Liquorilactobacillus ghanensis]KRM05212.1 glycosyltransferase [Liquorilactobacillus ghanensis DSM 18630]
MKVLSIVVPCYNSTAYLEHCVDSLLPGGKKVEIILVDDGSTDQTGKKIDYYARHFPEQVKAIHQANGGHGAAINVGLAIATGKYFKVVDSDDWLEATAYQRVIDFLTVSSQNQQQLDLLVCNFVYDKLGMKHKKVMNYKNCLPQGQFFGWPETKFSFGKYLLMHSLIYRTNLLRDQVQLQLPRHTFYEDNLYAFEPLPHVKRLYYLNVDLYHYFIGRADQSVNEEIMFQRIDQQLKINRLMVDYYVNQVDQGLPVADYLKKYLEIITTISSILLIKNGSLASLALENDLWQYVANSDPVLYQQMRYSLLGVSLHLPGKIGRKTIIGIYHLARRMYGFN